MLDFVKFLPLILQILDLIPKIQGAIKSGGSVPDLVRNIAPEVLPVLQQVGNALFPALDPTKATQAGALMITPEMVKEVQNKLNAKGYTDDAGAALVADGSYGAKTKQAVSKFQKDKGLTVDGWAGSLTQAALNAA